MQTLINFVIKNLKLNKKRTIVTIAGIMLSTALICSLSGIFSSFQKTFIQNAINTAGNYHTTFFNIPKSEQNIITKNSNIESYFVTQNLGYSKLQNSKDKQFIYLTGFDKNALTNYGLQLTKGRLPENDSEIIISNQIEQNSGISYNLGDEIMLNLGDIKLSDGSTLTQQIYTNNELLNSSTFNDINTKIYTIVGIIQKPNLKIEPYTASGYTVITRLDQISDSANFSVKFKNIKDTYTLTDQISKTDTTNKYGYSYYINDDLLRWYGALKDDNMVMSIYILVGIIILVIVVSSIFVIRNSFEISTNEKVKQFSILSCIGASKKQIKKIVLFEDFVLGSIGIILGVALGYLITYLLIKITDFIVSKNNELGGLNFVFSMPILAIIFSIVLSIITIYLSSKKSTKIVSRVSPIEAIKNSNNVEVNTNDIKYPLIIYKIFGVGGVIAYKNLKRNRKMYRPTVISLIISITIFIALGSVLKYSDYIINTLSKNLNYNVVVNYNDYEKENIKYDTFKKIASLNDVDNYSLLRGILENADLSNCVSESNKELYKKYCFGQNNLVVTIVSVGNDEYNKYLKEIGKSYQDCKDGIIWACNKNTYADNNGKKVKLLNLKIGDKISFENPNNKQKNNLSILDVTDKVPLEFENINSSYGIFIISDELLEKIGSYSTQNLFINSTNPTELCKQIKTYSDKLYITNTELERQQNNRILLLISIFLYGFVVVITIIGITSIFNTLNTSMDLRSKEFAMLKSIGMTKREFNKMINLESIFYSVKSLIIGTILGTFLSFIIYKFIKFVEISYIFPLKEILISIIFVVFIVIIIMKHSLNRISKQNIIETIRKENI